LPTGFSSTSLNLSGRIPELDGLRGIAIGSVLIWHYFVIPTIAAPATPLSYALVLGRLTWSGVDLFFVLSGFLIGGILLDARASTNYFRVFYTRRFFRIVPVYIAVLFALPLLTSIGRWTHHGDLEWFHAESTPLYAYWVFIQNLWMAYAGNLGGYGLWMTWSLAVEEQFYLTLPVLVRFFLGQRLLVFVLTGICLAPILRGAIHFLWPHNWAAPFVLMACRADALLLGVLAAILLRNDRWRARIQRGKLFFAVSLPLFLIGIVYLNLRSPDPKTPFMLTVGLSWLALFYVNVLLFTLTRTDSLVSRALRAKWLAWLGGIAYGTYLFHQPIQGLLFGYFRGESPVINSGPTLVTTLVALILTLTVARLSWRFFEQPLIRFGHQSNYRFAPPESDESPLSAPELVRS
jgi:peptidoglycan/LPS O-acetylase OafA/YrhL